MGQMAVAPPHLIHHIVVMWDESDHVSAKHSPRLADLFWKGYLTAFPEGARSKESPMVVSTGSPIFSVARVRHFLHEGQFVPYEGTNKDLAILKFCSTGFVDQDERFHFILDDLRTSRDARGHPPMHSDRSSIAAFVTSDRGIGMKRAIDYVMSKAKSHRTNFIGLQMDKSIVQGDKRMTNAGFLLGQQLKERLVGIENGAILLNLQGDGA